VEGDEAVPAEDVIDLSGKLLMPGLIDSHVHFNEPGHEEWEGYTAGSFAAAAGGITTALEMPFNATPPTSSAALLEVKREAVKDKSLIDYGHWAGLEASNLDELEGLQAGGVVAFKAFMCESGIDFEKVDTFALYRGMDRIARWGNVIGVHAENESLTRGLGQRLRGAGRTDPRAWAESRPPVAELEAIERAILLAAEIGGRLHIVHVTIPKGFEAIHRAKARGVTVTGEACPHYLALDEDDLVRLGPVAKCGPPLRPRTLVERLWQDVLRGRVDIIASDHCPCTPEMKQVGMDDIWEAWGGITGNQTMLPVMLTEGVHRRGLSLTSLVRMTSLNPARLYGLYPAKGHLWPSADADLVVVDAEREWKLSLDSLFSKHQQSPFEGRAFKGVVERTFVRGQTVYLEGEIVGQPGYGQLVRRANSIQTSPLAAD
jgi:allantoinase